MGNINRPDYLLHLQKFVEGIKVRVFHPPGIPFERNPPNFHAKAYLFERSDKNGSIIIGSSNFTDAGFSSNVEWNYYSCSEVNLAFSKVSPFQEALNEFERVWRKLSVEVTDEFLIGYRKRWRPPVPTPAEELFEEVGPFDAGERLSLQKVLPNQAQREALENLIAFRRDGACKVAVIAATGVGKTYLSAFDFKQSGHKRLLFVAHRENILNRARHTFGSVMDNKSYGVILGGGNHIEKPAEAVFAMIQTIARKEHLYSFPKNYFDYVVVDEFHHAEAAGYRRVLDHFQPRFLLGLTATPERMDGRDVLAICDYNVAYEVRLFDAIDKGWLTPFQYYAVYDPTDYEKIAWRGTHYDEEELNRVLIDDTRTEIIANNLRKFLPSSGKIKALAFCSSVAHAKYTAKSLTSKYGIDALALVGQNDEQERKAAISRLENEQSDLQVICCVDIFNEGIDIPSLSHVLFLRPTQSFTVFLQQLGRGLRIAEDKNFLVAIDFVGNYRKAHVAPLALRGYSSTEKFVEDFGAARKPVAIEKRLPKGCYVNADLDVKRIWDGELRQIVSGMPVRDRLRTLYAEIRASLGEKSPQLMDFFYNPYCPDPYAFLREFDGWLRTKLDCDKSLPPFEQTLIDTPGEAFLKHLELELNPVRSYKMVTLKTILNLGGTSWSVDKIAEGFYGYFMSHPEKIFDFQALANFPEPENYPLSRVRSHILRMPLHYLSNTDQDWFVLSDDRQIFSIKQKLEPYWAKKNSRSL